MRDRFILLGWNLTNIYLACSMQLLSICWALISSEILNILLSVGVIKTRTFAELKHHRVFYHFALLIYPQDENKQLPSSVPKKPSKPKLSTGKDRSVDSAVDKQRQEARKRLMAAKRAASVRQNSATESADSIEIYVPEAQTRLWDRTSGHHGGTAPDPFGISSTQTQTDLERVQQMHRGRPLIAAQLMTEAWRSQGNTHRSSAACHGIQSSSEMYDTIVITIIITIIEIIIIIS